MIRKQFAFKQDDTGSVFGPRALASGSSEIIDIHCHIAGIGAGSGCLISESMRRNWRFPIYLKTFGVTSKDLNEHGDSLVPARISELLACSSVRKAVILALDGAITPDGTLDRQRTDVYIPNEFALQAARTHSNLLFGASVSPLRPDALERLDWAKENGAVLLKWLPPIMHIDTGDSKFAPFYRKLAGLGLPLLCHTGDEHAFPHARCELGDPAGLRLPLSLGVTVIAAHVASPGVYKGERGLDRLARLAREFPNLYADVSSLTQINKRGTIGEILSRPEFQGRLLYGSDFPLINTALYTPWTQFGKLTFEQIRRISAMPNPWDRDVTTMHALGLPSEVFTRASTMLPIPEEDHST